MRNSGHRLLLNAVNNDGQVKQTGSRRHKAKAGVVVHDRHVRFCLGEGLANRINFNARTVIAAVAGTTDQVDLLCRYTGIRQRTGDSQRHGGGFLVPLRGIKIAVATGFTVTGHFRQHFCTTRGCTLRIFQQQHAGTFARNVTLRIVTVDLIFPGVGGHMQLAGNGVHIE